ncbi:MAG: hypothetical protein LBR79_01685 [Oscillospiraceae bacterium]|jgi:hypothetical protein|nr:hypothetical protein [Oscillospiraceae bacterium]
MKKYFLRFLFTFSIMCQILLGGSFAKFSAGEVPDKNTDDVVSKEPLSGSSKNKTERIIRKTEFGNGLEYVLEIDFSPESTLSSESGIPVYRRSVIAKGTYFMNGSDKSTEKLASCKFKVAFTYDKKTFCKIFNAKEDLIYKSKKSADKTWKIKQNNEILSPEDESICMVSLITNLYKHQKFSTKSAYFENSHIDFMCSKNGEIVLNSSAF